MLFVVEHQICLTVLYAWAVYVYISKVTTVHHIVGTSSVIHFMPVTQLSLLFLKFSKLTPTWDPLLLVLTKLKPLPPYLHGSISYLHWVLTQVPPCWVLTISKLRINSSLLIPYNEQCRTHDIQRKRFSFGTRDQAWSLKCFCVARVLLKYQKGQRNLLT